MILLVFLGIAFILALFVILIYNGLIRKKNEVNNAFGGIDVQLKKRYDLIPNLVATVQQYAAHEKELLEKVTQRFENKIKICQKIENNLPNHLISHGDAFLLTRKLDTLKLNLAILYTNQIYELTEDDYNEIKTFIFKILNFPNIHLKLKIFDLTIKLLQKTTEFLKFNKDFISILDLLKLYTFLSLSAQRKGRA